MKCRSSHHALAAFAGAVALGGLGLCSWAATAGATTFGTTGPSQAQITTAKAQVTKIGAQITSTKAQITQIEGKIATEQQKSAELSQQYDAAVTHEDAVQAALAITDTHIAKTKAAIVADRKVLAKAAVRAYVLGVSTTQITSLFAGSGTTQTARAEYEQTAVGNLNAAQAALQGEQTKLVATEAQQKIQAQQAQAAVAQVTTLRQQNAAAETAAQQTLQQVQGSLAQQVAAQAAAEAKQQAEEAAAAAAQAKKAAAAAAAAEAEREAQVAAELGNHSATTAANQAASSADPTSGHVGEGGTPTAAGQAAVHAAESQLGVPYVWGGETPGAGFDCSGLTQWSWAQAGVSIPRTATAQWHAVSHVSLSSLEPGDLLFYYNLDGTGTVDHVAMYVGSGPYGSQTIIQAPYTGATVSFASLYTYGLIGAGQP